MPQAGFKPGSSARQLCLNIVDDLNPLAPVIFVLYWDAIQKSDHRWNGLASNIYIQWGSENRTCLVFKWSKAVWLWNGPVFEWFGQNGSHLKPFENRTKMSGFWMVIDKNGSHFVNFHLKTDLKMSGFQMFLVFECFRFSNGQYLDPLCIWTR